MTQAARFAPENQIVFAATGASFLSATLLFSVQPMFTKMVLPVLGGSAATWSVAMVFFQAVLLLGYLYAHLLTRYVPFGYGAAIHIALLIAAFLTLPISFSPDSAAQAPRHPALWIFSTFTLALGLPFLALSTHGPLLQAWFAISHHERAKNPYFLYIASNIGSFAALLSYPFLIEPFVGLSDQSKIWRFGFGILITMIAATLFYVRPREQATRNEYQSTPIAPQTALTWMALGFIPSALLVSVTSHISTDVASAPLLWVAPLALYLLSYMIAFRDKLPLLKANELQIAVTWGVTGLLINMSIGQMPLAFALPVHLGLFMAIAVMCHHRLYELRPAPHQLTVFCMFMSLGGILGGSFAGILAPSLFSQITEYPLLIVATIAVLPGAITGLRELNRQRDILRPLWMTVAGLLVAIISSAVTRDSNVGQTIISLVVGLIALAGWRRPSYVLFTLSLGLMAMLSHEGIMDQRESYRSFFGVTHIRKDPTGRFNLMVHGTTIHGAIRMRDADGSAVTGRPEPTSYYTYEGPLGETIATQRERLGKINHAALIGLGTGALSCHFQRAEAASFYELDGTVARIAQDRTKFRYLSDCDIQPEIILGDARLTLAKQKPQSDVIIIDAFSSDAIPVHLLTVEAIDLYLSKLAPRGIIALHISNVYFQLDEVLSRAAASRNLHALIKYHRVNPANKDMRSPSRVAVLARNSEDLDALRSKGEWLALPPMRRAHAWSDDYSTILEPLMDMWREP